MSSTHSHGKLIAAVHTSDGPVIYIMFEKVCDSNVYPRTPAWSCCSFGDRSATLREIFYRASACEGGMLTGAGGRRVTPEGYIAGWLKELANPVAIVDTEIVLTRKGWRNNVPSDAASFEAFKQNLGSSARAQEVVDSLEEADTAVVSLVDDIGLLTRVYGSDLNDAAHFIHPSRLFAYGYAPEHGVRMSQLGYAPKKAQPTADVLPGFVRVSGTDANILQRDGNGVWRCIGMQSFVVERYIRGLWELELAEPGTYRQRIGAFRNVLTNAPVLPESGVTAIVDMSMVIESERDSVNWKLQNTAHSLNGDEIHVAVGECDNLWYVTGLPAHATRWQFDEPSLSASHEQVALAI